MLNITFPLLFTVFIVCGLHLVAQSMKTLKSDIMYMYSGGKKTKPNQTTYSLQMYTLFRLQCKPHAMPHAVTAGARRPGFMQNLAYRTTAGVPRCPHIPPRFSFAFWRNSGRKEIQYEAWSPDKSLSSHSLLDIQSFITIHLLTRSNLFQTLFVFLSTWGLSSGK